MADNQEKHKKPEVAYRVELEKRIEINKSFSERRNQAVAMRILSYGLFGQKRYQNLYLTCSLNCFHLALKIANNIHQRVAGLAMIIKFEVVQVLEYFTEQVNDKYFEEKKYSKILIKLTRNPTEEDKKEPGFNRGLNPNEVQEPLSEVLKRKRRQGADERQERPKPRDGKRDQRPRGREQSAQKNRRQKNQQRPRRQDEERSSKPFRQNPHEKVRESQEYRRGEKKSRGGNKGPIGGQGHREYQEKDEKQNRSEIKYQGKYQQSRINEKKDERDRKDDKRDERSERRDQRREEKKDERRPYDRRDDKGREERGREERGRDERREDRGRDDKAKHEGRGGRRPQKNRYDDEDD